MHDFLMAMPRKSAIIYPKDIAFILLWADIFPGARVFECGVGSGALSIALLRAIGPTGSLVSYDARADMIEQGRRNAGVYLGDLSNWATHERDVNEGIVHGPFDRMLLDLPDPGRVTGHAVARLVPGGILCSYVPNITQVIASVEAYQASGAFSEIETYETVNRRWEFDGPTARPVRTMISHTGWLTIARKGQPRGSVGERDTFERPVL
jgi:tRNA (adenine57-N1/adenine58-N1)-methyltransferase